MGDVFDLSRDDIGSIDVIYDRAALVALPLGMRKKYSQHLMAISQNAPQLLLSFEYDQKRMHGPPFSISSAEVAEHYQDGYSLQLLQSEDIVGGLKGKCAAKESVWLLSPKAIIVNL